MDPTVAVPLPEALALPTMLDRQREAHAEYKIYPRATIVKVRVCAYAYTQKAYQNKHKRDNLISRRASTVAKS